MSTHLLFPLLQVIFSLSLIVVVLRRNFQNITHRLFSLFLVGLAVWGVLIFGMRASPDLQHAYYWENLLIPVGPFIGVLLYHFAVRYTLTQIRRWFIPLLYLICFLFIFLIPTDLVHKGMQLKPYGYAPIFGPVFPVIAIFSFAIMLMALLALVKSYRALLNAEHKNRIAYIILGVVFMFFGGMFDILPTFGLPLYPGLIIGNIIFCLLVTVAIVRHNLLDIRVVLRKGTAYVLTSAVIAVPFVAIFLLTTKVFKEGDFPSWAYFIVAIVLAFALPHLWQWVQRWVDRWFYRDRYDYLQALGTFSQQTQSLTDSARLGSTMVNLIAKALRSSNVYLLQPLPPSSDFTTSSSTGANNPTPVIHLKNGGVLVKWLERSNSMLSYEDIEIIPQLQATTSKEMETLERLGAELISPLKAPTGQLSGILIMGKKLSEQPYNSEDKQLISTICNQMGTNLENVRLYNESQQEVEERRRAEEALRESQEALRKTFESVADGISVINLKGIITEVNQRTVEMHGFSSREELLGKSASELVAPCDHERIAKNMRRALKQGALRGVEYTLLRTDSSEFPGELGTSVLKDASGNLVGHVTIARDITKRKQAEAALKLQQAYFQQLFDNSPDAIVMLDNIDRVVQINRGFETLFGYQAEEIKDLFINELIIPGDCVEEAATLSRTALDGKAARKETVRKHKDGSLIDVSALGYPIHFDNKTVGVYVIYSDITERKQAEEREKELQRELYLSSRLASIGELAAGVAHQLNNPLTGVLGFSQRLLRKSSDQETNQDLRKIYGEAERAAKIVQNLLTFARRRQPKKEYSDLNNIVQSALELRAYELKASNIEVITNLAPGLPKIILDFHQIQEVFLNLILNAEQAMTEANSGGKLTIETEENKSYVRTTFTDDGPGIPAEHLDSIFDPFFTTKGEKGGTGLGLSVCHGIIIEHGGRIYAKCKPGKGTTFFVEFPIIAKE